MRHHRAEVGAFVSTGGEGSVSCINTFIRTVGRLGRSKYVTLLGLCWSGAGAGGSGGGDGGEYKQIPVGKVILV